MHNSKIDNVKIKNLNLQKNIDKFKCFRSDLTYNRSNYRLTVDYFEDFLLVSKILEALYSKDMIFSMNDALDFLDQNPDIYEKINLLLKVWKRK